MQTSNQVIKGAGPDLGKDFGGESESEKWPGGLGTDSLGVNGWTDVSVVLGEQLPGGRSEVYHKGVGHLLPMLWQ